MIDHIQQNGVWMNVREANPDLLLALETVEGIRVPVIRHFRAVNNQYEIPNPKCCSPRNSYFDRVG